MEVSLSPLLSSPSLPSSTRGTPRRILGLNMSFCAVPCRARSKPWHLWHASTKITDPNRPITHTQSHFVLAFPVCACLRPQGQAVVGEDRALSSNPSASELAPCAERTQWLQPAEAAVGASEAAHIGETTTRDSEGSALPGEHPHLSRHPPCSQSPS
jgi:hypothetical protein